MKTDAQIKFLYPVLSPDGTPKQDGSKKTCYESIHENTSFVFVHVTAYSCKSVVRFTYFFLRAYSRENQVKSIFKTYSKQPNFFLIQNV